jgi:alkylated DNA repair protein (DNA oxidative demethylase)
MIELQPGVFHAPGLLDPAARRALAEEVAAIIAAAPLFVSRMPRTGVPMSVRMTNCGALGWMSDRENGYRYTPHHPETGAPWPQIPARLLDLWSALTGYDSPPEACLVNVYDAKARMGLHQDRDEVDFDAPILSLSLGADCRFRFGGTRRAGPTRAIVLADGDALVMRGPARLCFHGVDRILPSLSARLPPPLDQLGARINLTLRRVG